MKHTFYLLLCLFSLSVTAQDTSDAMAIDAKGADDAGMVFVEKPFDELLAQAKKENKVIFIDAYTTWCGPCKMMAPAFEQAAAQLEPHVRLAKLNTEDEQRIAANLNIRSIPTMVMFKNGREVARQSGAMSAADIKSWIGNYI